MSLRLIRASIYSLRRDNSLTNRREMCLVLMSANLFPFIRYSSFIVFVCYYVMFYLRLAYLNTTTCHV